MITLSFPITPVPKGRPRFTRQGHAYTPEKTVKFEKEIRALALKQMQERCGPRLEGPLIASMDFLVKKPKRTKNDLPVTKPDLDNLVKAVCDALNGVVWDDDSQICGLFCKKGYGDPSIIVTVDKWGNDDETDCG